MAFERETDLTKDRIGAFKIIFHAADPLDPEDETFGRLHPDIVLSDGTIETKTFNLLARLQDDAAGLTHLANLASLRDYIEGRLNDEVLPL